MGWVLPALGLWALLMIGAVRFSMAWGREMLRQDEIITRFLAEQDGA